MKRLFYIFILVASTAIAFYACNKPAVDDTLIPGDNTVNLPPPAFTDAEGKYVSTIETDEKGKWVTIQYTAMGADGNIKNLSELIYLPEATPAHLAIGCHITITSDSERPTNFKSLSIMTDVGFLTQFLALKECLVVFPDYEGYGVTSTAAHPYLCREITARQVIAGAKAALDWLENQKKVTMSEDWDAYAIGYSQGGAVAAGVMRYYKEYNLDGLNLMAAICGDGPYDPVATLGQYINDDKLYMPVAAVLVLKGLVDTNKEMKALGCSYSDFMTKEIIDTKIFDLIASKENTTGQIHSALLAHSKEKGGFTMTVYNKSTDSFLPYNAENTAKYQNSDWELSDGKAKSYCTADQCFKAGLISYLKEGKVPDDIPEAKLKALEKALKENSLTYGGWKPELGSKEFYLFHSTRDEIVPFANYEAVLSAWGKDRFVGSPFENEYSWTHVNTGTQFVLQVGSFLDEYIKK